MSNTGLHFVPEDPAPASSDVDPWPVLVVDDDADVHHVTRLVLSDLTHDGRPLALSQADSAAAARTLLDTRHFALVLVDVVMESEHAGVDVIRHLRETVGERRTRVIVRTGQPGNAPPLQTVQRYDVSGYEEKSMQTVDRLRTAIVAALRTYGELASTNRHADASNSRMERLELAAAHADEALATLSDEVFRQQRQIDDLTRQVDQLRGRLAAVADAADIDVDGHQPPPHY